MKIMAKSQNEQSSIQQKQTTNIEIRMPSCIQIDLVQANELRHYEVALWLGFLFSSAAVGFWTAYLTTNSGSKILLSVSIAFTAFTVIFIWVALHYRLKLKGDGIKRALHLSTALRHNKLIFLTWTKIKLRRWRLNMVWI